MTDASPTGDPTVTVDWLFEHLEDPDLVLIDATWFMPGTERDARAEHARQHIPGALFLDIDEVSDHSNPLPHMLPEPHDFATQVRRLGVEPNSRVVVYDTHGVFSAPRVWWMFRVMGHQSVWVLDGGMPKWIAEGHPIESGWPQKPHGEFKSHFDKSLVRAFDEVLTDLTDGGAQLLDARASGRFTGEVPEPRPGLRSGHMPGARNLPSNEVVAADGTLKPASELAPLFAKAGIDLDRPIVTTCGSGISAAILALALARLGRPRAAVYDGSWTEWGGRPDAPMVTGGADA
ncbi:MAG: 3-mercaptopyruvate sulfurtransferase [Caulobacteraceae bacterium]|nr:3-mercaptopyruvate sulfurtransferase [Caulobacteraceae bacterium]